MRRKTAKGKHKEEWNQFGLRVFDYNVTLEWGFNSTIYDKRWRSDDSPVYESSQYLNLDCIVLWPEEQAGEIYHLTLSEPHKDWFFGPPTDFTVKLGKYVVKDKKENPKYRKYKHGEVGIYDPPFEIGSIDGRSGEFHGWVSVETEILSQMINLVLSKHTTYVHLRELIKPKPAGKRGKNRWITGISMHLGEEDERVMKSPILPVE